MRTASCDEEASNMGTLVRMDVGAILTSTNDRGAIPVILRDRILYEEPNGTWNKGYISGIWRSKGGRFYYGIKVEEISPRMQTPSVTEDKYTWRTIGGIQLRLRPRWSRPTDPEVIETLAVPKEQWTERLRWAHDERVKEAAKNAEIQHTLDSTRNKFRHSSEGRSETSSEKVQRMRRIRLAQTKAFEEECNLQFLKLTKDKVSKEVGKPSDTTRRSSHGSMGTLAENGVMNAKWCKFHKEWRFHTDETCNENPNSKNYNQDRGYKKGCSSMQ